MRTMHSTMKIYNFCLMYVMFLAMKLHDGFHIILAEGRELGLDNDGNKNDQSFLPTRLITVFGLESSGTRVLTQAISESGNVVSISRQKDKVTSSSSSTPGNVDPNIKKKANCKNNGCFAGRLKASAYNGDIEIQHLSLPWGMGDCHSSDYNSNTVPYLVPKECGCTLDPGQQTLLWERCLSHSLHSDCKNVLGLREYLYYPNRFFVNITSHVRFYQERNVVTTAVVITRDERISVLSKTGDHCKDTQSSEAENRHGMKIIKEAVQKLNHNFNGDTPPEIVLVSYEIMMSLGTPYFNIIFDKLGLPHDEHHEINLRDANQKYISSYLDNIT